MTALTPPDRIDLSFVPVFRGPVAAVPVETEAVLYEEDTGSLHRLDPIATAVCSYLDGQTSIATAVDELVAAFGAPREVVETDVLALVRDLGRRGLLEGVEPDEADDGSAVPAAEVDDGC